VSLGSQRSLTGIEVYADITDQGKLPSIVINIF
jgi:hypothetical protein